MRDKASVIKYAKQFYDKKYIESGYIAVRDGDGILITATGANLAELKEEDLVFVNDKNIDSFEGNFRAAAVILFCAIRQNKVAEAAAIVDSDSILKFSSKRRTLKPILDDLAQLCGMTVKCASKNVAAEVVTSLSGQREACFMPDAGALVRGRSLAELLAVTAVLDKAAFAELNAERIGCTQSINVCMALVEHIVYRIKTAKSFAKQEEPKKLEESVVGSEEPQEEQPVEVNGETDSSAHQSEEQENTQPAQPAENAEAEAQAPAEGCVCENSDCVKKFALSENGTAILVHPYYGSVISAVGKPFIVPEKFNDVLGQEIPCIPAVMTCTKGAVKKVNESIGDAPACIIAQHGIVIRGKDMDEALSICETLEQACKESLA